MSDLIRREDAFKAVLGVTTYDTVDDVEISCGYSVLDAEGWLGGVRDALRAIENIPSAEPERKKGEWIYDTERVAGDGWTYSQYHCSECGFQEIGGLANFCPHCGAEMRGDNDEEA